MARGGKVIMEEGDMARARGGGVSESLEEYEVILTSFIIKMIDLGHLGLGLWQKGHLA